MSSIRKIVFTGLALATVALLAVLTVPADSGFREVYRDDRTVWSFSPVTVVLKNDAAGCDPYYELWLKMTDRDRGYYDQTRVLLKKDNREYKFTDSIGYDPAGRVAEA
ncbi:MAG: hypothetical protein P4N41_01795 [Negativicutes bacterium]|nr:hypothetical protein [Negativicutes bacterium]